MALFSLIRSRMFSPIFVCMAGGAFNDNLFKNAMAVLITYQLAARSGIGAELLVSIATAIFILPFFLFSAVAGNLADRMAKHRLVRYCKISELLIVGVAAASLLSEQVWLMFLALGMLGLQSAVFGPVKYAILPELIPTNKLLAANGMVEAGTFLAILSGTLAGGLLVLLPQGALVVSVVLASVSAVGLLAALMVPSCVAPKEHTGSLHVWRALREVFRVLYRSPRLVMAVLGISCFWALGASYLTQIPLIAKLVLGGDETVVSSLIACFAIGIAIGSLGCQAVFTRIKAMRYSHYALLAMGGFALDMWWVAVHMPATESLIHIRDVWGDVPRMRLMADMVLLAISGGVFVVPLYTELQVVAAEAYRARIIAANNIMNAGFIAVGAVAITLCYAVGLDITHVLGLLAFSTFAYVVFRLRRRWMA